MIKGIHHLGLTVCDVDASAAWYERCSTSSGRANTSHPTAPDARCSSATVGFGIRLGLTQHCRATSDVFDETRIGLDHLAFAVRDRRELDAWSERLSAAGVTHSPIAPANSIPGAHVLVLRDPDNIQLELFADPQIRSRT